MPLKHTTETLLVFILGLVVAIFGVLTASLPGLPSGGLPWGILLALAILYPLGLYPLFKKNRADYAFRWLHWFPAFILLLWLGIEVSAKVFDPAVKLQSLYQWGFTFGLVTLGFIGIAAFCLHVIRRRLPRLLLLLVVFVPFVVVAFAGERDRGWNKMIAGVLWEADFWTTVQNGISGTGSEIAMKDSEPKNLSSSEDPAEEAWRERLRVFERRRQRLEERAQEQSFVAAEENEESKRAEDLIARVEDEEPKTGTGREIREVETLPNTLPSSGFGVGVLGMTMFMGYCGVIHSRARKRVI